MLDAPSVLFTITIPSAVEEQRLMELDRCQLTNESKKESTITSSVEDPSSQNSFQQLKCDSPSGESTATQVTDEGEELLQLPLDTPMEQVLQQIVQKFDIRTAIWLCSLEGTRMQISFVMELNELYEQLYDALQQWGIGYREGSSLTVTNCLASKFYQNKSQNTSNNNTKSSQDRSKPQEQKQSTWYRFMNSLRARLNVTQIVRDVRQDAAITFDFCILLVSAALLAAFGLVENSTIFLASSMLISPLMGPIIAAIFGTVIEERSLRRLGLRNELIGILLATLVGFLFGLVVCTTNKKFAIGEGLTEEMRSRCDLHSLIVGIFTAIPSGAAAAIAILGGNIGSLVGVAISASLLPPAVNSGLLWALACIYKVFEQDDSLYVDVVKSRTYSKHQATELAILGGVSMCLTIANIVCIYVMGILVLKVKEIAPVIGRSHREFWMHDIKMSRGNAAMINELLANLADEPDQVINEVILRHLDESNYEHTWSPRSLRHSFTKVPPAATTIHRLEQLFAEHTLEIPPANGISRRHTQRANDVQAMRPRFASMPSHRQRSQQFRVPETIIDLPKSTPRFVVTPAGED